MTLPFAGTWIVCNGGRDPAANVHPYAYDFVRPYRGSGEALEDYDAYGAEVLAPAAGVVCEVIDNHPDAPPGQEDATGMPNVVAIDHGNGEWSFLAHFRPASIRVQVGLQVVPGELVGLCGNSGDSTEPHIHVHLQSSPDLAQMEREMLPFAFANVLVEGRPLAQAEPQRGQWVSNASEG